MNITACRNNEQVGSFHHLVTRLTRPADLQQVVLTISLRSLAPSCHQVMTENS